jgi:hypothetical protein
LWRGVLVRPEKCLLCGSQSRLEAHHHKGYDEKYHLDVQWLCRQCHAIESVKEGTILNGTRHPKAKLTDEAVEYIRKYYQSCQRGGRGAAFLAEKFGVHRRTIIKIARREHWIGQ